MWVDKRVEGLCGMKIELLGCDFCRKSFFGGEWWGMLVCSRLMEVMSVEGFLRGKGRK